MAKPINHDLSSATATAGWETAKGTAGGAVAGGLIGAIGGYLGAIAVAAVAGAALFALPVLAIGPIVAAVSTVTMGGVMAAAGSAALVGGGLGGALGAIPGVIAGVMGGVGGVEYGALAGGMLGLGHGGAKVSKEKQAFNDRMAHREEIAAAKQSNAEMIGIQKGYMMGYREGQQKVVQEDQQQQKVVDDLQALQAQMIERRMAGKEPQKSFTSKCADKSAVQIGPQLA